MKKLIAIIMSIIAVVAVSTSFAIPAMANVNVYSPHGQVVTHSFNDFRVNNRASNQVSSKTSPTNEDVVTFTYTGEGSVDGWTLVDKNGNVVPLDENSSAYKIVSRDGNSITLEILDWSYFEAPDGYTVNAVINNAGSGSGTTTNGNKNDSSKSPSTGAISLTAASVVAAGAGVAALALLKKKDAE